MSEEQQQELSLEESQEQAKASFAAGYNKVRGDDPPTVEEPAKPDPEAAASTEEPAAEPEEQQPEPEKPIYEGLTPSQLRTKLEEIDHLKQENRKAFGKVGELNSRLQQFGERLEQFQQQPPTQRTPAKLKRLSEEFPDLAEALSEDLGSFQQGSNPEEVERLVGQRVSKVAEDFELKLLSVKHPDWETSASSAEFRQWGSTIPAEEFQVLTDSRDALEISVGLDKFKAWRDERRKQQAQSQAAEQRKAEKRQRIEAAATPTNGAAPPSGEKSPSDSFRAGYDRIARARQF